MARKRTVPRPDGPPPFAIAIPASVTVGAKGIASPAPPLFRDRHATILSIGRSGAGVSLNLATKATLAELADLFLHGSTCAVTCRIPGWDETAFLLGNIRWTARKEAPRTSEIQLGVTVTDCESMAFRHLMTFLAYLETHPPDEEAIVAGGVQRGPATSPPAEDADAVG